jgi:hypothetical protein
MKNIGVGGVLLLTKHPARMPALAGDLRLSLLGDLCGLSVLCVESFLFQRRIAEKLPSATSAATASMSGASDRSSVTLADLARTAS